MPNIGVRTADARFDVTKLCDALPEDSLERMSCSANKLNNTKWPAMHQLYR